MGSSCNGANSGSRVNFGSGNLFDTLEAVSVPGVEPSINLTFSYNSIESSAEALGPGWTHSYSMKFTKDSNYLYLKEEDGRLIVFWESIPGKYVPLDQFNRSGTTLRPLPDGSFRMIRKDGTAYDFNASGRLTRIVSRSGNTLTLGYTGTNLTTLTDAYGRQATLGYTGSLLTTVTDPGGRVTTMGYNNGYLSTVTDPAGRTTHYNYNGNGRLSSRIDPLNKTIFYAYDAATGRLMSATDNTTNNAASVDYYPNQNRAVFHQRNGYSKTVEYDPVLDLPLRVTQADNTVVQYGYDNTGRLLSVSGAGQYSLGLEYVGDTTYETDGLGQTSTYEYNAYKQLTRFVDPEGHETVYHYNTRGILDWMRNAAGETTYFEVNVDPKGKVTAVTDPMNRRMSVTYDTNGYPRTVTDNTGLTTNFIYDIVGNLRSVTDPSGITTQYTYDNVNRLTQILYNNGSTTAVTYDGNRATYTDANSHSMSVESTEGNKPRTVVDALNRATHYGYSYGGCSSCGPSGGDLLESVTNANGHAFRFEYDSMDRLEREIDPTDNQTVYGYHPEGTLGSRTDAKNRTTGYWYDPLGRLATVVNALNHVTEFEHRPSGFLDNVIDGKGYITQYSYDNTGRVTQVASWDSGATVYTYNPDGTLHTKTDGRGVTATYAYDSSARLTGVSFPDASENRSYTYDSISSSFGRGRLTGSTDSSGNTVYHYDSMGRVSSEVKTILGVMYTTAYAYDNVGNLTSMTYPSGRVVEYGYNQVDRPILVQSTRLGATTTLATGIAYDNVDHLQSMTLGNGIIEGRSYNAQERISSITALPALSLSFGYDAVGNIVELADNVTAAVSPALGTIGYSYLANRMDNVVEGSTTRTFGYDASGNTTWDGALEYVYNQDGRLKRVQSGSTTIGEYTYDGKGRRGIKTAGGQTRVFHYDRYDRLIEETDVSGDLLVDYVYLEDHPLAQVRPDGLTERSYYYHVDHLGTPKALTDSARQVVWKVPVDEFGNELAAGIRTVENNFRFPGQYYDQESGLHYNFFRDYDPKTGRYIEPDRVGLLGGVNLYTYVHSNPVNRKDYLGLMDLFFQVEGDWVRVLGAEGGFGLVLDTDNLGESGIFGTKAIAGGGNVGVAVGGGFVIRDIEGWSYNVDANFGAISVTASADDIGFNGLAFGLGPGKGLSVSAAKTSTYSVNDAIQYLKELWNKINGRSKQSKCR